MPELGCVCNHSRCNALFWSTTKLTWQTLPSSSAYDKKHATLQQASRSTFVSSACFSSAESHSIRSTASIAYLCVKASAVCKHSHCSLARKYLAELHDDVHHVALLIAFVVLDNVGVVQAVQHLHLILGLHTAALHDIQVAISTCKANPAST